MMKLVASNRKVFRDYEVLESIEAGIELKGSEVKSLRQATADITDSFARIEKGEIYLYNSYIASLPQAGYFKTEPRRVRKLLLHRRQIERLSQAVLQPGYTLVPTKLYFNERGLAKVELALCKGKKLYDRRADIKRRQAELQIRRAIKDRRKK